MNSASRFAHLNDGADMSVFEIGSEVELAGIRRFLRRDEAAVHFDFIPDVKPWDRLRVCLHHRSGNHHLGTAGNRDPIVDAHELAYANYRMSRIGSGKRLKRIIGWMPFDFRLFGDDS